MTQKSTRTLQESTTKRRKSSPMHSRGAEELMKHTDTHTAQTHTERERLLLLTTHTASSSHVCTVVVSFVVSMKHLLDEQLLFFLLL